MQPTTDCLDKHAKYVASCVDEETKDCADARDAYFGPCIFADTPIQAPPSASPDGDEEGLRDSS